MSKVFGPPEILDRAKTETKRLKELTTWKAAFADAVPETPLLVQRRDKTDADFYIVSFRGGPGVTARLRMNAHTGEYAEGIGIDEKGDVLKPYYPVDAARQRVASMIVTLAKKPKKKSHPVVAAVHPFPIWEPCAQSLSAFLPFYRFKAPGVEIYFRVDGKIHRGPLTYGAGL